MEVVILQLTHSERIEIAQVFLFRHLVGRYGYPFSDNLVCSFFSGLLMLISNKF